METYKNRLISYSFRKKHRLTISFCLLDKVLGTGFTLNLSESIVGCREVTQLGIRLASLFCSLKTPPLIKERTLVD